MNARNRQILKLLAAKFGTIGGEAYEVNGALWLDIEEDRMADRVFGYMTWEFPMELPRGAYSVQRTSNIQAPRQAI